MNSNQFEKKMRRGEIYHGLRVLDGNFIVLRVDGRGFSKLTKREKFEKPFDEAFHWCMVRTMEALSKEFGAVYGYTQSDEISILLPRGFESFDRSVEKLVSLSAAISAVQFTKTSGIAAHFDSRLWVGGTESDVVDYFSWRMADAERNSLIGLAYWKTRHRGQTRVQATRALHGLGRANLHDYLHEMGLNWNDLASWKKRGVGLQRREHTIKAFNPVLKETVSAIRSRMEINSELPFGDAYRQMIQDIIGGQP